MKEVDEDHKMWGKTIMNHDITRFASNPGSPADSPKDADDVNVSGVNIALKHLDSPIYLGFGAGAQIKHIIFRDIYLCRNNFQPAQIQR